MGTTTDKLNAVLDSKEAIRQAIEYRGVDIPMDTTLAEYADKIGEIPTGGTLTDEQALVFIGECAEGKRKIAKAVRSKYETITNEESGITEYSTFEEMSAKIADIPITVPMGSAMEQNGGVLPFYDVYNELVKASKTYTEYPYCCAMELDKWDYDNDHKVTLSGADAYLTSDGVYLRSSEVNGEYQFNDQDKPNSNRFVVYFFGSSPYQVPKSLPATSVFGLWCLKGTPLMNFSSDFTVMNSVNVYDGELVVKEANDFKFSAISYNQKLRLSHIKEIKGGSSIFHSNSQLREITLPNLTTISGSQYNVIMTANTNLRSVILPKLKRCSGRLIDGNSNLKEIVLSSLEEILNTDSAFIASSVTADYIELPKLYIAKLIIGVQSNIPKIILGNGMNGEIAGDIKILLSGTNTTLTSLIVAKGFKAKLNLTGCNGLSRDVLLGIINNLGQLDAGQTLNLIMGTTLLNKLQDAEAQEAIENATRVKGWSIS